MRNLLLLIGLFFAACTQEELPLPKSFPVPETLPYSDLSDSGVRLHANIIQPGDKPILEKGFKLSGNERSFGVVVPGDLTEGEFEFLLTADLTAGVLYEYKAYVKTEDLMIFGEGKHFTSLGVQPPRLISVSPQIANDGDLVEVTGKNFSNKSTVNSIYIQGKKAELISGTQEKIVFRVPSTSFAGRTPVELIYNQTSYLSEEELIIKGPIIESIAPAEIYEGDVMEIHGMYLDKDDLRVSVDVREITDLVEVREDLIRFRLPSVNNRYFYQDDQVNVAVNSGYKGNYERITIRTSWEELSTAGLPDTNTEKIFVIDGKALIAVQDYVYALEESSLRWNTMAPLPDGLGTYIHLADAGDRILFLGGENSSLVWALNKNTLSWQRLPDLPGIWKTYESFSVNGSLHIMNEHGQLFSLLPDDTFSYTGNYPEPITDTDPQWIGSYTWNGQTYVSKGEIIYRYDEILSDWVPEDISPSLQNNNARYYFMVRGLPHFTQSSGIVHELDPATNSAFPISRFYNTFNAFTLNGTAYVYDPRSPDYLIRYISR